MEEKKNKEFLILELFRELYPDFPKGVLSPAESPDFILSLGHRTKIGIELTRLTQRMPGSSLFSFENLTACLSAKDKKLVLYKRKNLREYWLILYARDPVNKPLFNLHNKLINWEFKSGFNKVFLLYIPSGRIYRLNPGVASPGL